MNETTANKNMWDATKGLIRGEFIALNAQVRK